MLADIRKSVAAVFYERTTSPLYGAFAISWLVWNWKIPYVTLFVDEKKLDGTKLQWIIENCSSTDLLVVYPLLSTAALLCVVPFLANGAYWLSLRFAKWKVDSKNRVEQKTLLTVGQSVRLREELLEAETKLEKLLELKNDEIRRLSSQVKMLEEQLATLSNMQPRTREHAPSGTAKSSQNKEVEELVKKISSKPQLQTALRVAVEYIQGGYQGLVQADGIDQQALAFLEASEIIESEKGGTFRLTERGKKVLKGVLHDEYSAAT